ncbi:MULTISPECIES: DUF2332 family protein [unclassified Modestobacter]|uniref:DUF2332 family protein n=1 Tax=unclassified Modestobacter TaxID=2643866 RepID=UPI0022AA3157|nr:MULTISPECIES: DUF2332 family protein [unclassified Modestobacter]MCZ2823277.1 DUF2332 family protein [Modestobacter sp. VKM Ac-2981]MCZ2851522.1 DUF2332 family protein [Modestobacter sp. VKM Ac-2982]
MRSLDEELTDLADHYRWFAQVEAAPLSPRYAALAAAVAEDAEVLAFLGTLPRPKRQANLLLGALQYGPLVNAGDVRAVWAVLDPGRQRAVVDALRTVTLHSPGRGRRNFDAESVGVTPR